MFNKGVSNPLIGELQARKVLLLIILKIEHRGRVGNTPCIVFWKFWVQICPKDWPYCVKISSLSEISGLLPQIRPYCLLTNHFLIVIHHRIAIAMNIGSLRCVYLTEHTLSAHAILIIVDHYNYLFEIFIFKCNMLLKLKSISIFKAVLIFYNIKSVSAYVVLNMGP
jgi:hypothetical protein